MPRRQRLTEASVARLQAESAEYTVWDTHTPALGVRLRASGGRSYVCLTGTDGGARGRRHTLGPTTQLTLAAARRACLRLQIAHCQPPSADSVDDHECMTLREFVETAWAPAFLDQYKPSTRKGVRAALRRELLAVFGSTPLARISPNAIHQWFDRYSASAPGGANHALKLLRAILRYACRRGYLHEDHTAGIRLNPGARSTRFLSRDELGRLHLALDACEQEHPSRAAQADIIRLLLLTGCRRGEIVNLRRDEVEGPTLRLRDSKTGPKVVYLNKAAQRILAQQPLGPSPYVFPSPIDPAKPRHFELPLWYRVRRRAGLEDVRLHDCRHTFASQALLQGAPVPVVARLLGHRDAAMTLRYAHVRDPDVEAAAERVGAAIHRLLSGAAPAQPAPATAQASEPLSYHLPG
ncbi:MAG: tyrosine-type recombinase/integrase [Rhodospirillales bacterium]|nr:tyrosine-type recombinase/integrase [Rhodospirillales bacterium]